jgi:cobalt/nickel transport system permease protein
VRHSFVDRYGALDSPLHALDARTKIVGFVALTAALLALPPGRVAPLAAMFVLVAALLGVSQIPLGYVVRRSLVLLPFVALAALGAGRHALDGGLAALLARSLLALAILVLLANTTRFPELLGGLRRLGCPRVLALNLGFLYRYLFVLTEEVLRMRQARDCRRVRRAAPLEEMRLLGGMLGSTLVRSFERAERMHQAMLSRAFAGEFRVLDRRRFGWPDLVFLAVIGSAIAAVYFLALRA